jgi:hypothetical protein
MLALEAGICFWAGSMAAGRAAQFSYDSRMAAALWQLAVALPVTGVGTVFAAFCVAYWRKRRSTRAWATAAGGTHVFIAAAFVGLVWATARFRPEAVWQTPRNVWGLLGGVAGLGAATIAAFWRWNAGTEPKTALRSAKIAGDGTHPLVDKLVGGVSFAGLVAGIVGWLRWAQHAGLPQPSRLLFPVEVVVAALAMGLVHELGHALTGTTLGMRLRAFVAGPFQWRVREGRWRFQLRLRELLATGGSAALVPTDVPPADARAWVRREVWTIAGGPAASLLYGLAALAAVLTARGHAWEGEWRLLALFTTFSLLAGVMSLLPFHARTGYSDGAQIYQLLSGGAWDDSYRVLALAGSSTVTQLRPRDFDLAALERAAGVFTDGLRGTDLRLLAYCCNLDCGRLHEASLALNEAEALALASIEEIPVEFCSDFVFAKALVQRDAEGTRAWWARLEAKEPEASTAATWLARAASLWMDGAMGEAKEAWEKGNALAQALPQAGAYDFERDKYAMLRRELDAERRILRWHDDATLLTY